MLRTGYENEEAILNGYMVKMSLLEKIVEEAFSGGITTYGKAQSRERKETSVAVYPAADIARLTVVCKVKSVDTRKTDHIQGATTGV